MWPNGRPRTPADPKTLFLQVINKCLDENACAGGGAGGLAILFVDNAMMRKLGLFYCVMPGLSGALVLCLLAAMKIAILDWFKGSKRGPFFRLQNFAPLMETCPLATLLFTHIGSIPKVHLDSWSEYHSFCRFLWMRVS